VARDLRREIFTTLKIVQSSCNSFNAGQALSVLKNLAEKSMTDLTPIETEGGGGETSYSAMPKAALEALAIAAIREHRRLLAADEVVYEEWTRANDGCSTPVSVLMSLQDEYLARQRKSEAQQCELSEIIDALGYVPEVSVDDELK
jgi:hypothetical protein